MSTFITGAAGTGKTTELVRQALEAAERGPVLLTSVSEAGLSVLRERVRHPNASVRELHALALESLSQAEEIDDVRAAMLFAESARPLLTLEWRELIEAEVDPEVPGLRAPERFLDAAFRLFCKLRDARISPEQFLESALRGATQFYAKPPNLASPELLYYTKDTHRDSLHADAAELQRQYRREIDLAKILAKLYRSYLDHPVRQGCLTPRDVIAQAADFLQKDPSAARSLRERHPLLFVDDAQELTIGEMQLLQSIYGNDLDGATLAGDQDSATSTFRGARPDRVFALPGRRVPLDEQRRSPFAVDVACRHLLGTPGASPVSTDPQIGLTLFRASTRRAEAQYIAEHVVDLLTSGVSHDDIAIVFRSVRDVRPYRDALLDRNVRVQIAGDLNVFAEPEALDALAILWAVHDPFRHDYLLRVLSGPAMALSDATVYALCSEPPDAQTVLFEESPGEENGARSGRWDVKRDLRLAWNVLRGDQDDRLSPQGRERVQMLRAKLARWREALTRMELAPFARLVWSEGLAAAAPAGSARAAHQQQTLGRLHDRMNRFAQSNPAASLGEFLEYAQARMESDFETWELREQPGAVRMLSIDAARGREFDHVVIPRARAGSFPRWYAPDAFLYSPSLGMIAKENVGDAHAARTAKFTYYMFRTKAREAYNKEERRAFVYALRRAKKSVLVTASERATRGIAAPEFLHELQAARLPGTIDVSDRWHPTRAVYAG
ncbi:MAG TPA: 3'-5' exonuclease [Candidatus Baltobacteraceae bacterium]|nr:3'-5' exonuclease [Candidatus Baltobacteraceae bacterium]